MPAGDGMASANATHKRLSTEGTSTAAAAPQASRSCARTVAGRGGGRQPGRQVLGTGGQDLA